MKISAQIYLTIIVVIFSACDKRLPKEQVEAFKEEMEERKIKRFTENEIAESAQLLLDSLNQIGKMGKTENNDVFKSGIYTSEDSILDEKTIAIIEAYSNSSENIEALNFQKLTNGDYQLSRPAFRTDSLGNRILLGMEYIEVNRTAIIKWMSK